MPHYQINCESLIGFVTEDFKKGELARVIEKVSIASDQTDFHKIINQIYSIFFSLKKIPPSSINTFLILLRPDNTADVYVNDFEQNSVVKLNRDVKAGEEIYEKDILDITKVEFPDITINSDDAIIYLTRLNWKFGLYFDFSRNLDLNRLSNELGYLFKEVGFKHLIETTTTEIEISTEPIFLITEGKTDWQHLENAKQKLALPIGIDFHKGSDDRGDSMLFQMCQHYSITDHGKILIFMFDRDNTKIKKDLEAYTVSKKQFQNWGNNVYSFCIPVPNHRKDYQNLSIEFYYKDEEIKRKDRNGKRLFFDNELEMRQMPGEKAMRVEIQSVSKTEFNKKIYDKDVTQIIDITTGKQIALSKSNFAQNIFTKEMGFDDFDVSEFNKIFDIIKEIIIHSSSTSNKNT